MLLDFPANQTVRPARNPDFTIPNGGRWPAGFVDRAGFAVLSDRNGGPPCYRTGKADVCRHQESSLFGRIFVVGPLVGVPAEYCFISLCPLRAEHIKTLIKALAEGEHLADLSFSREDYRLIGTRCYRAGLIKIEQRERCRLLLKVPYRSHHTDAQQMSVCSCPIR